MFEFPFEKITMHPGVALDFLDFEITWHSLRKDVMTEIRKLKAEISHAYRFKELENGQELTLAKHNALMAECGTKAEQQDEILAGIKGQLHARANRAKK